MLSSSQLVALRAAFDAVVAAARDARLEALLFVGYMDLPSPGMLTMDDYWDLPEPCVLQDIPKDTNFAPAVASSDAVTCLPKLRPGRPEQLEYG